MVALGLLALGCAHEAKRPDVFWPLPPEKPRIRFVRAFATNADLDSSPLSGLLRSLTGARQELALKAPLGLAVSDDGQRVYVADNILGHVLVADLTGKGLVPFAPNEPMGSPFGVALDANETVYVSDSRDQLVRVYSKEGKGLMAFGRGDFVRPTGIALDRARRRLYVVDSANQSSNQHRVLVYNPDTGQKSGELGPADGRAGTRGSADGDFYFPTYVAVDAAGNVFVADTLNFRVQIFGPDGKFIWKFGSQGDGPGTFNKLKGLAFDGFGNLYTVDTAHGVVQIFNAKGQLLMDFGGLVPTMLEYFDLPAAIAVDPIRNRIYVGNTGVPRVNVYELIDTTAEDSFEVAK